MRLVTYLKNEQDQLALYVDGNLYDTDVLHPDLPISMAMFLNYWEDVLPIALAAENKIRAGMVRSSLATPFASADLLAPVPHPSSCREASAFGPAGLGSDKKVFDQYPVFFHTNHNSVQGAGNIVCMPDHMEQLDFDLQAAIVVCKSGRNIPAAEADEYIGGLMIMNGFSARKLQLEEMLLQLGPAKGKDFAIATGPMLVTLDELATFEVPCKENHTGKSWNLPMRCSVNGQPLGEGNLSDMQWTFAELIERASYGVQLFAGDIIGSGAPAKGSLSALRIAGAEAAWLQEGDEVELEIEGLGKLSNTITRDESDFSILSLKK